MKPLALLSVLRLSLWCGLAAGLLEVATIVVRKQAFDANRLYGMSRHFVWLIPVANVSLFLTLGLVAWTASKAWPYPRARWLAARGLCAITVLPMLLIAFPRIYTLAWLVVAIGVAARIVTLIELRPHVFWRVVKHSLPVLLGIVLILRAAPWVSDQVKHQSARAQPLPPPGSPNVLLIVLDTVAAGHLSLYGYGRPTSTTLVELAEHGIRFDAARAASSWTLPSHATMFTGRWMHELSVGWLNPLDDTRSTLAEYLGSRGYATAGFVANTMFCASDTGLARGFTEYEDFIFPEYTALKTAVLCNRLLAAWGRLLAIVEQRPSLAWMRPGAQRLWHSFVFDRKRAADVNRELVAWLARQDEPERPFFAFLNYADAHTPYELADGRPHRFGAAPSDERQRELIKRWGDLDKVHVAQQDVPFVVDSYDDCIADLDEQIGRLLDRLGRQGILERSWVIIASDHGESFGEHAGVFCHGTSLYQTELHVPLLIVPPGGSATKRTVKETVSLRDLAATIVDVLGLKAGSPLPGHSLAHYWRETETKIASDAVDGRKHPALSEVVPGLAINTDAYGLPKKSWPLGTVGDGGWSYIRGEGRVREELFHLSDDAYEQHNLAGDPAARPILDRMRQTLSELTGGPLVPERFNR